LRSSKRNMLLVLLMITLAIPIRSESLALNPVIASLGTTIVKVDPALIEYKENAVGKEFTVAINIIDVTNLYGFDIKFRWNTTFLDYVSHSVRVPRNTYADGVLWNPFLKVKDTVTKASGTYEIAYTSMNPAPSFNGTGTVFTMTFRVKYHPSEAQPTAIIKLEFTSTDLAEKGGGMVTHSREPGTVILQVPKPIKVEPSFIEFGNADGDPIAIPGTQFTVAAKIYDVTDLYGFDFKFKWNTTFLDYVSHTVRIPKDTYPDGVLWDPFFEVRNEVDAATGTYWIAYSSMTPAPSFNGSGTAFTMTFEVIKQPFDFETGGPSADPIDTLLDFVSTDLAARPGYPIAHYVEPATVRIWERSFSLPPQPLLKVMPTSVEKLPIDSTFNIEIWILGLNQSYDMSNFNITLTFNSTLIRAIEITQGSMPRNYADGAIEILKQINDATGTATYSLELVPPRKPDPPTASILFTVTFKVIYESLAYPPPFCELALYQTNITDRTLGLIPHLSENATYTANRPSPVAKFTWSPHDYLLPCGQMITFNASESYHPLGGHIELYQWDFGDGNITTTKSPIITHVYTLNETMTVILKVIDYGGFWDTEIITLYIFVPPPKPRLAVDPTYIRFRSYPPSAVGQQFDIRLYVKGLDAAWSLQKTKLSLSYNTTLIDTIGDAANVTIYPLWMGPNDIKILRPTDALGKITITVQNPSVIPSGDELVAVIRFTVKYQGTYPAVDMSPLTLSDIELTSTFGEIPIEPSVNGQIVIKGLSQPLSASFAYSPPNPKVNETVTFDASNSAPNGINIANYTWNFADGNITEVSTPTITHRFSKNRTYNVTLTVTDIEGLNNTTSKMITIEQATTEITPYIIAGIVAASVIIITIIYLVKIRKPKHQLTMVSRKSESHHDRRTSTHTTRTFDGHGAYISARQ